MRSAAAVQAPRLRVVRPGEVPPEVARARAGRSARRSIAALAGSVGALTVVGLVMVLSASSVAAFAEYGSSFLYFKRQLLYAAAGGAIGVALSRVPYHVWRKLWRPLFAVTLVLLVLVLHPATGTTAGGSARWITLGPISVQPSELAKLVIVMGVAAILDRNMRYLHDPIVWGLPVLLLVGLVSALILLQPDLGTMMIVAVTVLLMLFLAGVRLRLLSAAALFGLVAGMALIMTAGYRRTRFLAFLDPWSDPKNTGYQIVQSLIALGSGHLFGVGLGASRQKWRYVPNAHTDFIFSILGEELGLVGEVVVLVLFGALLYAGVRIALRAPDNFGRLLAGGITTWIGLQTLINLGAVTGVLPITGVPLPFVSFGGSSLVVSLAAMGVLVSIGRAGMPGGGAGTRARRG